MITYELAKELKEAGFPQDKPTAIYDSEGDLYTVGEVDVSSVTPGTFYTQGCGCCSDDVFMDVRVPNLGELIEACGDGFAGLIRRGNKWDAGEGSDVIPTSEVQCRYSSPEEAVAKLWLKLNKKQ